MNIEEGKFYLNRKGGITGPMKPHNVEDGYAWEGLIDGASILFTDFGRYSTVMTSHHLDLVAEYRQEPAAPAVISHPMYGSLAGILQAAHDQAASGKGRDRHSDDKPFLEQPIMEIARMLGGTGGHSYQIMKKAQEANRMVGREQYDAAVAEYLGVINYAAAAILLIREL